EARRAQIDERFAARARHGHPAAGKFFDLPRERDEHVAARDAADARVLSHEGDAAIDVVFQRAVLRPLEIFDRALVERRRVLEDLDRGVMIFEARKSLAVFLPRRELDGVGAESLRLVARVAFLL